MSVTAMFYGFMIVSIALVAGVEYYIATTYDDEY